MMRMDGRGEMTADQGWTGGIERLFPIPSRRYLEKGVVKRWVNIPWHHLLSVLLIGGRMLSLRGMPKTGHCLGWALRTPSMSQVGRLPRKITSPSLLHLFMNPRHGEKVPGPH
jgi:hypothetical protein